MIRKLIPPSVRFELREAVVGLREKLERASLWRWEIAKLQRNNDSPYDILYVGRKERRDTVKAILGLKGDVDSSQAKPFDLSRTVIVTEMPFPGALKIPCMLGSVVPLGRPIEEITAGFHSQLRRDLKKNRERYRFQQVLKDDEIEKANREMLQPYARARHGDSAFQIKFEDVRRMAQDYGRLDLLLLGDEVVGCQLGCEITRAGKRYWSTNRCGYPQTVFSDHKQLRDTNAINIHLALEWALNNNFDFYDIGTSLGRPDDGLLEWKRRRGGVVDTLGNNDYIYIRLPKKGVEQFLWDAPLFAVESGKLTLHLGLPDGRSDEEIASRYREMGFGGLFAVSLYCAKPPSEALIETLRSYFSSQKSPPNIRRIITPKSR
jgi:hypothetical protein